MVCLCLGGWFTNCVLAAGKLLHICLNMSPRRSPKNSPSREPDPCWNVRLIPTWAIFNTVKHLTAYCLVPQISPGPSNEEITCKIQFNVGKTCSMTEEGATPPITVIITRKGAAPLTHSLFGRYSASLSFPLVSPEKRERVPTCVVRQ